MASLFEKHCFQYILPKKLTKELMDNYVWPIISELHSEFLHTKYVKCLFVKYVGGETLKSDTFVCLTLLCV